ncbi:MAG: Uma2 family endonuclease [Chloroflexota bacterium]
MSTQEMMTKEKHTSTTQSTSSNGHTIQRQSSNGDGIHTKTPPVAWQIAPQSTNGIHPSGVEPRGYVFLPDYEDELIPLHELPNKPWWPGALPDHTQLPPAMIDDDNYQPAPIRPVIEDIEHHIETAPRGYVSLPDYEDELIPLHELPNKPWWPGDLPDHTQLPDSDDEMKNYIEHPQSIVFTTSIRPVLERIYGQNYKIGQDTGIYWRWQQGTEPLEGKRAPDWFFIPDIDPVLTRSHVMWRERIPPYLLIEFVSGSGREERDDTQATGKFWVYETVIQSQYYAIYEEHRASVELYTMVNGQYRLVPANSRGHYPIPSLNIELGIWQGTYSNHTTDWLRVWDSDGNLLLSGEERAEVAEERVEVAEEQIEQAIGRAEVAEEQIEQAIERAEVAEGRAVAAEDENARLRALLAQHGLLS